MEKHIKKMCVLMRRLEKQHRKMLKKLPNYVSSEQTDPSRKSSKSKLRSEKEKRKREELEKILPERPNAQEVMTALKVVSSNFYRNIYKILLFPDDSLGQQRYYYRDEVIDLAVSVMHEPGAHTYSKLRKKKLGNDKFPKKEDCR